MWETGRKGCDEDDGQERAGLVFLLCFLPVVTGVVTDAVRVQEAMRFQRLACELTT